MKRHISSYFLFLCILISSAGCSGDNEMNHFQEEISFSELKTEQLLKAPMIRNPKSIQMVRDRLIIAEAGGTPVLHFFEVTESGKDAVKYIRSTGREGRGPGEFIRPMEIVPADSIFYVYDGSNFKMTAFSLEGELMDKKSITLSTRGLPNSIFILNDMRLLLAGMFMHERFQVISMKDSMVNSYGEYPVFDDRFTPRDNGIAWLSHAALSSDDRYVYLFAENAEYVEKYTTDGKRIKWIQGKEYPVPDMKLEKGWPVDQDGIVAYTGAVNNEQSVYAAFSGKKRSGSDENPFLISQIHQFSPDLELQAAYRPDHEPVSFTIYKNNLITLNRTNSGHEIRLSKLK